MYNINKDYHISQGTIFNILMYNGKESKNEYIYMTHFIVHLKHCKSTILHFFF